MSSDSELSAKCSIMLIWMFIAFVFGYALFGPVIAALATLCALVVTGLLTLVAPRSTLVWYSLKCLLAVWPVLVWMLGAALVQRHVGHDYLLISALISAATFVGALVVLDHYRRSPPAWIAACLGFSCFVYAFFEFISHGRLLFTIPAIAVTVMAIVYTVRRKWRKRREPNEGFGV